MSGVILIISSVKPPVKKNAKTVIAINTIWQLVVNVGLERCVKLAAVPLAAVPPEGTNAEECCFSTIFLDRV